MEPNSILSLMAAADPQFGLYVNPLKIAGVLVLLFLWAATAIWVDKDTNTVKTKREHWNVIVAAGGLVAFFVLLMPLAGPLYFAALGFWVLVAGGTVMAYVVHRNGRVIPTARVLTPHHFKRLLTKDADTKRKSKDKGQRVRLQDHAGEKVESPEDPQEFEDYNVTQEFLFDLIWRRATDADILAGREKYRLVFRVDGVATENPEGLPPEEGERIVRYLKKLAGLNPEEIRRPQTGKIKVASLADTDAPRDSVVQTSGTTAGERLRLRLHSAATLLRVQELGLAEARLEQLNKILKEDTGLILVSAPPQNGLTTTQYAILRSHDAYMQNVHTLERRVLMSLDNITQQVYDGNNPTVSYGRMLQTVVRREPDVVMVGECEDRETAMVAARGVLEDRKIYVGMRAKDCFDALSKYLAMLDDNQAASETLRAVVGQRLIRILCTECREAFRPDPNTLKKLNLPADKIERFYRPPSEPLVDKKGRPLVCTSCQNTGYVGRTGMFELMVVDDALRGLIAEGAPINRIKSQCRKNRMHYLQEEGLLKVIDGTTSLNEILRVLRDGSK